MIAGRKPAWVLIEEERRINRQRRRKHEEERQRQIAEFQQRTHRLDAGKSTEPKPESEPEPKPSKPPLTMSNPKTGRVSVEAQLQYRECQACNERLPLSWFWPISEQERNRRMYSRSEICRDCAIYQDPEVPDGSLVIPDSSLEPVGIPYFRRSVRVRLRSVRTGAEDRRPDTD